MRRVLFVIVVALLVTAVPSAASRAAEPTTRATPAPQQREWTFLGAAVGDPSAEQRRQFQIGDAKGAFVHRVLEESPAAKADIRAGDFITRAGDVDITSPTQIRDFIRARQAGEQVTFDVMRDGEKLKVTATLEKRALPDRADPPVPARRQRATTKATRPATGPSASRAWPGSTDVRPEDLVPEPYRVHPGDVLEVSVSYLVGRGVENVKICRISDTGTISLPLVRAIRVAGMTEAEVNQIVRQALSHLGM